MSVFSVVHTVVYFPLPQSAYI